MLFLKNIIKKIKTTFKKQKTFEEDNCWNNIIQDNSNWSFCSILDKEDFFKAPKPVIEQENQFITKIKTSEYIIFTSYKKFRNYLVEQNLINPSLKIYHDTHHKRLNSILG